MLDGEDGKKRRELEEEEERLRLAKLELDKKAAKEKVDEERGFMGKVRCRIVHPSDFRLIDYHALMGVQVHDVFDGGAERKAEEEAAAAEVQQAYEAEKRAHEHIGDKVRSSHLDVVSYSMLSTVIWTDLIVYSTARRCYQGT